MEKEEEIFQKNHEDLPWTNFKVGKKQKMNIQDYIKNCIEERSCNV